MRRNLGPDDVAELLRSPALAILATRRADGSTMLSPVWHEWADGGMSIVVVGDDLKSRHMQRDPRISVLVAQQEPPYAGFELCGSALLSSPPDVQAIVRRIAIRYLGSEGGDAYVAQVAGTPLQLVRLLPGSIRAWDFRDEFG